MSVFPRLLVLMFWLGLAVVAAHADAVVTVCGKDVWPGDARTDFAEALLAGGHVAFACSGIIELTRQHGLHRDVHIDGGGKITLDGKGRRMFGLGSSGSRVSFSRIRIEGGGIGTSTLPGSVIVGEGFVSLLEGTTIARSQQPVWLVAGDLVLRDAWIRGNSGPALIVSDGVMDISDSRFTDNTGQLLATSRLSSVRIDDSQFQRSGASNFGGADATGNCQVVITRSWFVDNSSADHGGAILSRCKLAVEETIFERNRSSGQGGAIFAGPGVELTMRTVTFTANDAGTSGGAVAAAGELSRPVSLFIRNGRFKENRAALAGGAIAVGESARAEIGGSTLLDNVAGTAGGAIYARQSPLFLGGSLLRRNRAASGGAVQTLCAPATSRIANSIIADNVADAGGAYVGGNVRFLNATVVDNGNLPVQHGTPCGPAAIEFANTVLEGGTGGVCAGAAADRSFRDLGHNLQFPWSTCGATIPAVPPLLGWFYAPIPLSPASASGDLVVCKAAPINGRDVYGTHRPQGSSCSIGAVEGDLTQLIRRLIRRRRGDLE
ncbi:MAG TPA: hypothetical protein VNS34_01805 [Rhizobiaceae bacterium]|nr:hypothetical protein [Rhizobiaceae bacterium]